MRVPALIIISFLIAALPSDGRNPRNMKTVHVIVALCDNENQGIVPVPVSLGNGKDPEKNLYWGAAYGVKTFFRKSRSWKMIASVKNPSAHILERCVFVSADGTTRVIADAYDGGRIREATVMFLDAAAGHRGSRITAGKTDIPVTGEADLVCYAGHDGQMDFRLQSYPENRGGGKDVIILACSSRKYFSAALRRGGGRPLIWTTDLFCPEAYTLEAAINGWMRGCSPDSVREMAAAAYSKYQRCGIRAARKLIVTGWE